MSKQNKQRGNKPEKLELPEIPKGNAQDKKNQAKKQIPFGFTLDQMKSNARNQVFQTLESHRKGYIQRIEQLRSSKVVVYYSVHLLDQNDYQAIYEIVNTVGKQDNLDLFILSPGGFAGPAYKIARLFQDFSNKKFSVLIPYYAKSAATILSLGADEIVMGPASELGPIDPQIQAPNSPAVPALSLKEALDYITKEVQKDPKMAPLYVPLLDKVNLMTLGHFEREIESAKQYGEELLRSRKINPLDEGGAKNVSDELVRKYKTHGFVIDGRAATNLLGDTVTLLNSDNDVWQCLWNLHNTYDHYLKEKKLSVKMIETLDTAFEMGVGQKR